jgi:hypothetical protein
MKTIGEVQILNKEAQLRFQAMKLPIMPRYMTGIKKDGSADKRCKNGWFQMMKLMEQVSGTTIYAHA